jgi:multidrug resistance efflux pump
MACFNRPGRFRGVCLALLGLCLLTATSMARVRSGPTQSEVDKRQQTWTAYAEANLRLAEADLAEAERQNRAVKDSVSKFDVERLRLHCDFAKETVEFLRNGGDYGELLGRYAELHHRMAKFDLAMAEAVRRESPGSASNARLERMRRHAEVYRLQAELAQDPAAAVSIIDHLHWETHRLAAELMQLNRRVERLEEIGPK